MYFAGNDDHDEIRNPPKNWNIIVFQGGRPGVLESSSNSLQKLATCTDKVCHPVVFPPVGLVEATPASFMEIVGLVCSAGSL